MAVYNISAPVTFNGTGTINFNSNSISNFVTTTSGDLIYQNPTSTLSRLPIGSTGQILAVSASSLPSWQSLVVANTALTDQAVGYNGSQFTTLGPSQNQRMRVTLTNAQSVPNGSASAALIQFNVINDDPLGMYNSLTFQATIPQDGVYLINFNWLGQGPVNAFIYIKLGSTQVSLGNTFSGPGRTSICRFISSGTIVGAYHYANGAGDSILLSPANLNSLEIKRII